MRQLVANPVQLPQVRDLLGPMLSRLLQRLVEVDLFREHQIELRKAVRGDPVRQQMRSGTAQESGARAEPLDPFRRSS